MIEWQTTMPHWGESYNDLFHELFINDECVGWVSWMPNRFNNGQWYLTISGCPRLGRGYRHLEDAKDALLAQVAIEALT